MATLFKRDWQVIVDDLDVSNLEFSFHATKNVKAEPNKLELRLYNLTNDHVAQITKRAQAKKSTGVRVDVEAGYVGSRQLVFRGDSREIHTEHNGPDRITVIAAHDGGRAYRESRVNQSFAPGASPSDLIGALATALNIGRGNSTDASLGATINALGAAYPNGVVLSGKASDQLTRVTRALKLTWSVQNGVLQLQKSGQPLQTSAVRLATDTGLVGSPSVDMDASTPTSATAQKRPTLVSARALMIPDIYPGRKVVLDSESFTGGYQVVQANYVGDVAGNDWNINMKLRPY